MGPWLVDIESLEQVSQDEASRKLVLRMAQLSREGRLEPFMTQVASDLSSTRTRAARSPSLRATRPFCSRSRTISAARASFTALGPRYNPARGAGD